MKKKKINTAYGNIQSISGYKKVNPRYAEDVLVACYIAVISNVKQSRLKSHKNLNKRLFILRLAG